MSSNNKVTQSNTRPSASKSAGLIWSELKKVTWPTRKEAIRLTILVLIISGVIGAILSVIDFGAASTTYILKLWCIAVFRKTRNITKHRLKFF